VCAHISFGADQFTQGRLRTHDQVVAREREVSSFFVFFYFCINLGSVASFIVTPLVREHLGYACAFALPALLLIVATAVFWSARKQYFRTKIGGSVLTQIARVMRAAWKHRFVLSSDMTTRRWLDWTAG
jgi:dipeptide/tripeptide permease